MRSLRARLWGEFMATELKGKHAYQAAQFADEALTEFDKRFHWESHFERWVQQEPPPTKPKSES